MVSPPLLTLTLLKMEEYIKANNLNSCCNDIDKVMALTVIDQIAMSSVGEKFKMPVIVGFGGTNKAVYWDMAKGSIKALAPQHTDMSYMGFSTLIASAILRYSSDEFKYYLITDEPAPRYLQEDEHCIDFLSLKSSLEKNIDDILESLEKEVQERKTLSKEELSKKPFLLVVFGNLHRFDVDYNKYDMLFESLIDKGSALKIACFTAGTPGNLCGDIYEKYKYTHFINQAANSEMCIYTQNEYYDYEEVLWTYHSYLGNAFMAYEDSTSNEHEDMSCDK